MEYTPFNNHTIEELLREVATTENPSHLELELAERITQLLVDLEDARADLEEALSK